MASDNLASEEFASDALGSQASGGSGVVRFEPRGAGDDFTGDAGALAQAVREQLARDIADIEQASAALRRAAIATLAG
jgi:hypothetical protein